jgi:preprotein translocase subunit SecE
MAARAESRVSVFDTTKLLFAIVLLVCGVIGFYYFSEQLLLYRVLGVIGLSGIAVVLVLTTVMGRDFLGFLRESRVEVRKMFWPTRAETMQATLVVVALVFVVGIILWLLDMFLFWGVGLLTGQGA